jgi:hypothetical protein
MRALSIFLVLAAVGGCGASATHSVTASDFQQSCSVDSDCVAVYEGTLGCCGPGCPNAAINQTSHAAYDSTVSSRTPTCSPADPCVGLTAVICRAGAVCANGTCAFQQPAADASSPD